MKKYSRLTDAQIDRGLEDGSYREDGILIRNNSNGETVKVRSQRSAGQSVFPTTFVQVNNFTVYQSDLTPVFKAILDSRTAKNFQEMEESYGLVLEYFENYVTYGDMLPDLLRSCMKAAVSFDKKIRNHAGAFDLKKIEEVDLEPFIGAISAYLNIIFIYISASFINYGSKLKINKNIINKIISLRKILQELYEQLIASSTKDHNGADVIDLHDSLYLRYMIDNNYNTYELEEIVQQDSRFESVFGLLDFLKKNYVKEEYENSNWPPQKLAFKVPLLYVENKGKRTQFVQCLLRNLNDLDRLEKYREEMLAVEIDEELVELIASGMRF